MKKTTFTHHASVLLFFILLILASSIHAADWPMFGGNAARTGSTPEQLSFPLVPCWVFEPTQTPRPAWPQPGKEMHRMDFDYAPQPVVSEGLVVFCSNADDSVRALDMETGKPIWRFTTGGPCRFAPAIVSGKVILGSDDGWVYALETKSGQLIWKFRGAPRADQLLGNERMISRWPIRGGVVVMDNAVYFAAGMWPAEGVYVYALDVETGKVIWVNDTSGTLYCNQPHGGASAFTGVCPQGNLLASGDVLLVPSGRTTPAAYDRRTGKLLYYQPYLSTVPHEPEGWQNRANGGSWSMISTQVFFSSMHQIGAPERDSKIAETDPLLTDGLITYSLGTGYRKCALPEYFFGVTDDSTLYAVKAGEIQAINLASWLNAGNLNGAMRWSQKLETRPYCMALSGNAVVIGGRNTLTVLSSSDGKILCDFKINGQARCLAISNGHVIASTQRGEIFSYAYSSSDIPHLSHVHEPLAWDFGTDGRAIALANKALKDTGTTEGYALIAGEENANLATVLASQSKLHVISALRDSKIVTQERARLLTTNLYGTRVAVQKCESNSRLPYASYFADVVVATGDSKNWPLAELYRVTRPCGGKLYLTEPRTRDIGTVAQMAGATRSEVQTLANGVIITRGPLQGAGEWRSQWADGGKTGVGKESRVKPPFEVLWFGSAGPDRMMSRHWNGAAPLSVTGRVFVPGQHHVIAMDAYNGRELWCTELENTGRQSVVEKSSNFIADDDSLYIARGSACYRLNQATGKLVANYKIPSSEVIPPVENKESSVALEWPPLWQVFGPFSEKATPLSTQQLQAIPSSLTIDGKDYKPSPYHTVEGMIDFTYLYGGFGFLPLKTGEQPGHYPRSGSIQTDEEPSHARFAYAFTKIQCPTAGRLTIGAGADCWMWWFLDGQPVTPELAGGKNVIIPKNIFTVQVTAGEHVLAARVKSGSEGWCLYAMGGAQFESYLHSLILRQTHISWSYLGENGNLLFCGTTLPPTGSFRSGYCGTEFLAFDKNRGDICWKYKSKDRILSNVAAYGDGKVFLVETNSPDDESFFKIPDQVKTVVHTLIALDMKTGRKLWEQKDLPTTSYFPWMQIEPCDVKYNKGIVVVTDLAAYDASTGKKLWTHNGQTRGGRLIHGDWLLGQNETLNLRTGEERTTTDMLTSDKVKWQFARAYGCGPIAGCQNMLFFRSGTTGFFDMAANGTTNFGGVRPGCAVTMIPANGLMNIPEGSSGCSCAYNFQTSLALIPRETRNDDWYVFQGAWTNGDVKSLSLNFGAPGDRREFQKNAWLGFPRPSVVGACPVAMNIVSGAMDYYYARGTSVTFSENTKNPWIYTSGVRGAGEICVDLRGSRTVPVELCSAPPTSDGRLNPSCWENVAPITFEGRANLTDPAVTLKLCRDANNLYLTFHRKAVNRDGHAFPYVGKSKGHDEITKWRDSILWNEDYFGVTLTDEKNANKLWFAVGPAGGYCEGRTEPGNRTNLKWDGDWKRTVTADAAGWGVEMAIPFETLRQGGVDPMTLRFNCGTQNASNQGRGLAFLMNTQMSSMIAPWSSPLANCERFASLAFQPSSPEMTRSHLIRLHFADLEMNEPGHRVFNVALQGVPVLTDFDIAKEAGGARKPLIKEFKDIKGNGEILLSLTPKIGTPILSGMEIINKE